MEKNVSTFIVLVCTPGLETLLVSAPHTGVMKLLVPSKIGPPDRKFWGTMKAGIEE